MERQLFVGAEHESRAVYLYAGQSNTHTIVNQPASAVRSGNLPAWMTSPADLDFLNPQNPMFVIDRALFSCGPYLHGSSPRGMFSPRPGVTILGDSGGFQFIGNPGLWRGDATRRWVLGWQEQETNEAITLDIPTAAIGLASPWPTFQHALDATQDSLRYFEANSSGGTRHLNALQGRDRKEALTWYDAVKWFPGGGWAFGGVMRENFLHVATLLDLMARQGMLGKDRNRVHFLGMSDLRAAVLLSAIQRGMRIKLDDPDFLVTFDTSSPSMVLASRKVYGFPKITPQDFAFGYHKPPTQMRTDYGAARWPLASSRIGSLMRMGDVCVPKSRSIAQTAWDGFAFAMLLNHNVHSQLAAIQAANIVMELHPDDARQLAPPAVVDAYQALLVGCAGNHTGSHLRPFAGVL